MNQNAAFGGAILCLLMILFKLWLMDPNHGKKIDIQTEKANNKKNCR